MAVAQKHTEGGTARGRGSGKDYEGRERGTRGRGRRRAATRMSSANSPGKILPVDSLEVSSSAGSSSSSAAGEMPTSRRVLAITSVDSVSGWMTPPFARILVRESLTRVVGSYCKNKIFAGCSGLSLANFAQRDKIFLSPGYVFSYFESIRGLNEFEYRLWRHREVILAHSVACGEHRRGLSNLALRKVKCSQHRW